MSADRQDGNYIFTFKGTADNQDRLWVFEGTTGSDSEATGQRDLLAGRETTGTSDTLHGGFGDDMLYGGWTENDTGIDYLYGGSGKDKLYGGAGNDYLEGGTDDDILVIGAGIDTYVINSGDGHDTIIEEREADGKIHGIIKINNGTGLDSIVAGEYFKQDANNIWEMTAVDGSVITLTHNATWSLTLADGSTLNLGSDFQDGDFGIKLADDSDLVVSGTDVYSQILLDAQGNPVHNLGIPGIPGTVYISLAPCSMLLTHHWAWRGLHENSLWISRSHRAKEEIAAYTPLRGN